MSGNVPHKPSASRWPTPVRPPSGPGATVRWLIRLLALAALAISGYLAWVSFRAGNSALGCGGLPHFDCEHVLTSRWSVWLGLPISLPAAFVYATILTASLLIGPRIPGRVQRTAWAVLVSLAITAAGAAVWFSALLLFVLKEVCFYCMTVHACGLTIAGLALTRIWVARRRSSKGAWMSFLEAPAAGTHHQASHHVDTAPSREVSLWVTSASACVGVAILLAGQLLFPPKQYRLDQLASVAQEGSQTTITVAPDDGQRSKPDEPAGKGPPGPEGKEPDSNSPQPSQAASPEIAEPEPEPPIPTGSAAQKTAERSGHSDLAIVDGELHLDPHDHPILGAADAKYIAVELFDYTCSHCRTLHKYLRAARDRYGKQFAVIVLVVPLNTDCNKYVSFTHHDQRNACRYARLALAVWRIDPEKFEEFHDWLLEAERPPEVREATKYAVRLVGQDRLDAELLDARLNDASAIHQRIDDYARLYQQTGGRILPKMVAGKLLIQGQGANAQEIFGLLERALGIKPAQP